MTPLSLVRSICVAIGIATLFHPIAAFAAHPPGDGAGPGYCSAHGGWTLPYNSVNLADPTAASFMNVYPCGPQGGTASGDLFMGSWQCVEFAARYLFARGYEIAHYDYGKNFAAEAHSQFPSLALVNQGYRLVPSPGDIISMWGDAGTEAAGHVAVVTTVTSFDSSGNATIRVVEENASASGNNSIAIGGWGGTMSYGAGYYHYTHFNWLKVGQSGPVPYATPFTAFQANTGDLWTVGSLGHGDWHLGMMKGTSPSIAALPGGGYEVAFEANTTDLWTVGSAGSGDWHLGMMQGTSPSIAALPSGGYEVAFEANTTNLWTVGSAGSGDWHLGMMAGTSPSITAMSNGGYEVAFEANNGELWTVGSAGSGDWHLGMMAGTSPSIVALPSGGYEVAFEANNGELWTVGSAGSSDWHLGMMAGTSPNIAALPNGGYEVAFQANTGDLWTVGSAGSGDLHLGLMVGSSPGIAA